MKRRDFFKGLAGVIAGFVIVPVVIKEIAEENKKSGFFVMSRSENNYELFQNGEFVVPRGGWDCHNKPMVDLDWKMHPTEDYRIVLFTADGEALDLRDLILK